MYRLKYALGIIIVLTISLLSCKKDDNSEPIPQLEPPYIRMKVDGKWWNAKEKSGNFLLYPAFGKLKSAFPWEMEVRGINKETWDDDLYEFEIRFPFKEVPKVGKTYTFKVTNLEESNFVINFLNKPKGKEKSGYYKYSSHSALYINGKFSKMEFAFPMTVTINEIKKLPVAPDGYTEYTISGTFSGTVMHRETKKTIEITDGEFKSVIRP